jgi:hypothetical protein
MPEAVFLSLQRPRTGQCTRTQPRKIEGISVSSSAKGRGSMVGRRLPGRRPRGILMAEWKRSWTGKAMWLAAATLAQYREQLRNYVDCSGASRAFLALISAGLIEQIPLPEKEQRS